MSQLRYRVLTPSLSWLMVVAAFVWPLACAHSPRHQNTANSVLTLQGKSAWPPFEAATLKRDDNSEIDIYIARKDQRPRPTLLLIQGSHCLPLFMMNGDRKVSPLMFQGEVDREIQRVNIVTIERRNLKSFGPPPTSRQEADQQKACTEMRGGLQKESRVSDAVKVAKSLLKAPWVSELHLVGHSEGSDVVAGVARALAGKQVKTIGLMAGAGITRFFEDLTTARQESGSKGVATILSRQIALTLQPEMDLHDYSYAITSSPFDDLKGLGVPLFVAAGDQDKNANVAGAEAFVTEMLRDPNQPIMYLMLPGLDHGFFDKKGADHSGAVFSAFVDWALAAKFDRSVTLGLPKQP